MALPHSRLPLKRRLALELVGSDSISTPSLRCLRVLNHKTEPRSKGSGLIRTFSSSRLQPMKGCLSCRSVS